MANSNYKGFKKLEFPLCAVEALAKIESLVIGRKNQDYCLELINEDIFVEKSDRSKRNDFSHQVCLSLIQEFQLVIVLFDYFSRPGPDANRNAVFLSLFSGSIIPYTRSRVLVKLISTALSSHTSSILNAAGTWMQQLGPASQTSLDLVKCLIEDFVTFSNKCLEHLRPLPCTGSRFCINFMTSVTELYLNDSKGIVLPPNHILQLLTEWVTDNPLLYISCGTPSLPVGAIPMPLMTPLSGLIRWCVLAPFFQTSKDAYSKLHLGILHSLTQLAAASGLPPTLLNVLQLSSIITTLKYKTDQLIEQQQNPETDMCLQIGLERFAQSIQLALAARTLSGNIQSFLNRLEILPRNPFLLLIVKTHKIN